MDRDCQPDSMAAGLYDAEAMAAKFRLPYSTGVVDVYCCRNCHTVDSNSNSLHTINKSSIGKSCEELENGIIQFENVKMNKPKSKYYILNSFSCFFAIVGI